MAKKKERKSATKPAKKRQQKAAKAVESETGHPKDPNREVLEDRMAIYGPPSDMSIQVAAHWTAILRAHFPRLDLPEIPPHLVGLMMAALKIHRASAPYLKGDADSYVDLHNYAEIAREIDSTLPSPEPSTP